MSSVDSLKSETGINTSEPPDHLFERSEVNTFAVFTCMLVFWMHTVSAGGMIYYIHVKCLKLISKCLYVASCFAKVLKRNRI